jgi:hypothetical protein
MAEAEMRLSKFTYLFLWLFFSGLLIVGTIAAGVLGYWSKVPEFDRTYISVGIFFVFLAAWIFSLQDIRWITKLTSRDDIPETEHFQIEVNFAKKDKITHYFLFALPALGFMGTLVGIMFGLSSASQALAAETVSGDLRPHILGILSNISTASFTTIVGLAGLIFLELFHLLFWNAYLNLLLKLKGRQDEDPQHQ